MHLEKYIVLSPIERTLRDDDGYAYTKHTIGVQLVNGFTGDKTASALSAKESWDPIGSSKDRLYFLPGCNVPRFKVREHFSVTIKPEYATACFVSADTLKGSDTMFEQFPNMYDLSEYEYTTIMTDAKDKRAQALFFMLCDNNHISGVMLSKTFWNEKTYNTSWFNTNAVGTHMTGSRYQQRNIMKEPRFQLYGVSPSSDLGKLNCDIHLEEGLLKHLNKDNLVLTDVKYQELRSFGQTTDKENVILMMELMSNCDFEKSIVYLLFLLKEFGKPISELKESNHVNFKSLLSFMKLKQDDIPKLSIVDMTRILRKHNQFTRTNAMTVSMLFAGDSINYSDAGNTCWKVGPVLDKDCLNLLND